MRFREVGGGMSAQGPDPNLSAAAGLCGAIRNGDFSDLKQKCG